MVPLPALIFNQIAFPLQLIASRLGESAIAAAGIPVVREGNVLELSNITLNVAEACSGIRSLISLITLAIVLAYFAERRRGARSGDRAVGRANRDPRERFPCRQHGTGLALVRPSSRRGSLPRVLGMADVRGGIRGSGRDATHRAEGLEHHPWPAATCDGQAEPLIRGAGMFARAVIVGVLLVGTGTAVQRAVVREPRVSRASSARCPFRLLNGGATMPPRWPTMSWPR